MKDNSYPYLKLNVRPDQLQRIKVIAAQRGISMIDLVEEMINDANNRAIAKKIDDIAERWLEQP